MSFGAKAQIYEGVDEIEAYYSQLEELELQLRSNPRQYQKNRTDLFNVAIDKNNNHLLSIILIFDGSAHYYMNDIDSALYYFNQAIELTEEIGCERLNIAASIRSIFCDENDISAIQLSRRMQYEMVRSVNSNDTINMIYSLNGLALFHERMDSTEKSLRFYYQALTLSEQSNNLPQEGFILNNLGLAKLGLGARDSAYADYKEGLRIAIETNDLRLECHIRENIGNYYLFVDSIDLAEIEFEYVLKIGEENEFADMQIASIINLSNLARRKGDYEKSDSLNEIGLRRAKDEKMFNTISILYLGRATLYKAMGYYEKSLACADSSLTYAEYFSTTTIRKFYHQFKSGLYETMGDDGQALYHYKEYKEISDSLRDAGNEKILDEYQFRYDDEKKERQKLEEQKVYELALKQNEIDMAKYRQNVLIGLGAIILVLAILLIFYFRLKQKSDNLFSYTIVNKLEEERGRIARDLHDGLGQSMIILKNKFGSLEISDESEFDKLDENISEIIEEIRGISRTLIPPELKRLGLVKAIDNMMNEIEKSASMIVTTDIEVLNELELEGYQNLRLYRILQELTTNTLKHSGATSVKISAEQEKEGEYLITYQDNGTGLDMEKWKSARNSVGFRSIEQRLKYLRGTIKIEKPKKGFKVQIKIKQN